MASRRGKWDNASPADFRPVPGTSGLPAPSFPWLGQHQRDFWRLQELLCSHPAGQGQRSSASGAERGHHKGLASSQKSNMKLSFWGNSKIEIKVPRICAQLNVSCPSGCGSSDWEPTDIHIQGLFYPPKSNQSPSPGCCPGQPLVQL